MESTLNKLNSLIKEIRKCKLKKTCPELDESRQYYFEPNSQTIKEWKQIENTYLNRIDNRVVFIAESPGGNAKGAVPHNFPTDGSEIYRSWAVVDNNPGIKEKKLVNNKKYREFRELLGLENCFLTNVCKCGKIPKERKSKKHLYSEITNCSKFLEKELEIINPSLIVAVGNLGFLTI